MGHPFIIKKTKFNEEVAVRYFQHFGGQHEGWEEYAIFASHNLRVVSDLYNEQKRIRSAHGNY